MYILTYSLDIEFIMSERNNNNRMKDTATQELIKTIQIITTKADATQN